MHRDVFYVRTNEGAPRWRVFRVDPRQPERAAWKEIVAERKDVVVEAASIAGHRLVLSTMKNASSGLEVRGLDGKLIRELPLPTIGTVGGVVGDEDEDDAYFYFVSFTTTLPLRSSASLVSEYEAWSQVTVAVLSTMVTCPSRNSMPCARR